MKEKYFYGHPVTVQVKCGRVLLLLFLLLLLLFLLLLLLFISLLLLFLLLPLLFLLLLILFQSPTPVPFLAQKSSSNTKLSSKPTTYQVLPELEVHPVNPPGAHS